MDCLSHYGRLGDCQAVLGKLRCWLAMLNVWWMYSKTSLDDRLILWSPYCIDHLQKTSFQPGFQQRWQSWLLDWGMLLMSRFWVMKSNSWLPLIIIDLLISYPIKFLIFIVISSIRKVHCLSLNIYWVIAESNGHFL